MTRIFITNLGKYNEGELMGEWFDLPCTDDEFQDVLLHIGVDGVHYEEWFITDYETDIDGLVIDEYENIEELSEIVERFETLDRYEQNKVKAVLEWGYYGSVSETIDNIDRFTLYKDICDEKELGEYYFEELYAHNLPENLHYYFDYEKFGRDISYDADGTFTEYGWIQAC